jgi:unsaturated rhamnogalacturonyl hydrolase
MLNTPTHFWNKYRTSPTMLVPNSLYACLRRLLPRRALLAVLLLATVVQQQTSAHIEAEAVRQAGERLAQWQVEHFHDMGPFRALPPTREKWYNRKPYHELNWKNTVFYIGLYEFSQVSENREDHINWLTEIGKRNAWNLDKRLYHADDHAAGQLYTKLYSQTPDSAMIAPAREQLDKILQNPSTASLQFIRGSGQPCLERWSWCDALFMSPPVWARIAQITGDQKYLDFMHSEYRTTYDLLWDKEEQLFFRDTRFFEQREANGEKVFWSRGNGWVIAGLALMLPDLPEDWEHRQFYETLFLEMAATCKRIQRPSGTWSAGLLGGEAAYPVTEISGTSLITFALAWGVQTGRLHLDDFRPTIVRAWQAIDRAITPEGMVGNIQPIGFKPGYAFPDFTETFGSGTALAAAASVYKLCASQKGGTLWYAEPQTYARYIPERKDDFAWENDVIAFRAYGPSLREGTENSGIDCWLKRVPYPIVDKWYKLAESGQSYHKDHGEGLDNYHTGASAGCGGTAIWLNGKREPLETYTEQRLIRSTQEETVFELSYERKIGEDTYGETKTIRIEMGQRLFSVDSKFTINGQPAANLPIAIGLTTHDGKGSTFFSRTDGWIACWENIGGSDLGTAVKVEPKLIDDIQIIESPEPDESHILIIAKTDADGRLSYRAGYGWEKAEAIMTRNDWEVLLSR